MESEHKAARVADTVRGSARVADTVRGSTGSRNMRILESKIIDSPLLN